MLISGKNIQCFTSQIWEGLFYPSLNNFSQPAAHLNNFDGRRTSLKLCTENKSKDSAENQIWKEREAEMWTIVA